MRVCVCVGGGGGGVSANSSRGGSSRREVLSSNRLNRYILRLLGQAQRHLCEPRAPLNMSSLYSRAVIASFVCLRERHEGLLLARLFFFFF